MDGISEKRVALDWLGCVFVCAGIIWTATLYGWSVQNDAGYLSGVLARSLISPYQMVMLSALCAVPLHALWTFAHYGVASAVSYDAFGQWAQTLFTSLGFLGTIIGVSLAVAGLEEAMSNGEPGGLIAGLSTAFDTTFLGLLAALFLMVLRKLVRLSTANLS